MSAQLPLRCRCGLVRGTATDVSPRTGTRLFCYCDDCQAYARFLARQDVLDAHGGTEIFHLTPSQIAITEGEEHLRCLRLSPKGMLRWFAGCCNTPIGNTISARLPFVGLVDCFIDHAADGRSRDEALGPPVRIHGRFARGGGGPDGTHPSASMGLLARSVGHLVRAWLAGKGRPSPFFDDTTGVPCVAPRVLTPTEREGLRPAA
jgi:hypothetical protein